MSCFYQRYQLLMVVALFLRINADGTSIHDLSSLKHASIDVTMLSVSGLSSGGFMANTMHYVFSSKVKGAGIFAGGPFNICYNISHRDFVPVYSLNLLENLLGRTPSELQAETVSLANQGIIDPVTNIKGSKSYVYQGGLDHVNAEITGLSRKVIDIYKHFGSDMKFLHLPLGTHSVPTDNHGGPCQVFNALDDGVNNCGIESIFEMFEHFYGNNYKKPKSSSKPYTGTLYDFDQSPYTSSKNAATDFMNDHGGIYIPLACQNPNATCKLHAAFHGCYQTIFTNILYDKWALHAGYLQAADENNIIVMFPRTATFELQPAGKTNFACWDWFGAATTSTVPFKQMPQVKSVTNILNAIIGTDLLN